MKALYLLNAKQGYTKSVPEILINEIKKIPGLDLVVDSDWDTDAPDPEQLSKKIREFDILILSRNPKAPDSLAKDPGHLKYICYLHGSLKTAVGLPVIQSSIQVTNWGDHTGHEQGINSFVLLLASLKDIHKRIMAVRQGRGRDILSPGGWVKGIRIGVYGYGFAGKEFVELMLPLKADVRIYDPYAQGIPHTCTRVDSLEALFDGAQALVIHAALTEETRKSVTAELLAKLPDQGIVINTARGAIIDQNALFAELKSGRLRAGLDVLSPDELAEDDEARRWENLIWTCHRFHNTNFPGEDERLVRRDEVVLENLRAFVEGKPLKFIIDEKRFTLMT